VRDRVINILRHDPTARASQMKKDLEKKYNITLSYYVVWDGMAMALEELQGKWDDSFEDVFRFKAEVERTNPGSIVDSEWALVGKKMRFTRMFVAFNSCVQGFFEWMQTLPWCGLKPPNWEMERATSFCFSCGWTQLAFSSSIWCI